MLFLLPYMFCPVFAERKPILIQSNFSSNVTSRKISPDCPPLIYKLTLVSLKGHFFLYNISQFAYTCRCDYFIFIQKIKFTREENTSLLFIIFSPVHSTGLSTNFGCTHKSTNEEMQVLAYLAGTLPLPEQTRQPSFLLNVLSLIFWGPDAGQQRHRKRNGLERKI